MRILGIDPGLTRVGLGLLEASSAFDVRVIEWLTLETSPSLPLATRLEELRTDLASYLKTAAAELAVVERLFLAKNQKTAFDVAHARGVIMLCCGEAGMQTIEPTPLQLKHAICGDGSADKAQMQRMLVRLLKLDVCPKPADAADALALALYGAITRPAALAASR